ncbi:MAG: SEC-C domain-containing protein [Chlamydiales bacterium]|nr:SEC-C domain-containing protein [Chlamydiales bacterium]
MNVKRNAPCPCGSQKKYKHCCLAKSVTLSSLEYDVEWQRLRQIEGEIWEGAFAFAKEEWGTEIVQDGWDAFCLGIELEKDSPDGDHLFPGWFVFRWVPSDYSEKWEHLGPNLTIADLYLQKYPVQEYGSFLFAVDQSPFSFFLVEDVIPSRRLVLKDLLLDRTVTIKERAGADPGFKGMVAFARLISLKDQSIQISFGTTPLPIRYAMNVLDLKQEILKHEKNLTTASLMKYDDDLREAYLVWAESAYLPQGFCNNDGDPIVFCTLHYKLKCSPKEAFDQLASLCKGEDPNELLEDGEFDKNRELKAIQFPWFKNRSNNLILGDIKIKRDQLTIHVNSVERSKKIRKEIEKRLPEALFKKMDTESPENLKNKKSSPPLLPSAEEKEIMKAFLKNYYRDWLDTSLPALHGKTPREAAKTADGRERLELLLCDFELNNQEKGDHLRIDVQALRQELGLLLVLTH